MTGLVLDYALRYADAGWHVFPLRGKAPAIDGGEGCYDGTTDVDQLRNWWSEYPEANIGIHAGASGLVVLDPDGPAGLAEWDELAAEHGPWPETFTVVTPGRGGGRHHYYRTPPGLLIGNRDLGLNINSKSLGGYVVAPPSIHPDTQTPYQHGTGKPEDVAELPDWVAGKLRQAPRPEGPPPEPIPLKDPSGTPWGRAAVRGWRDEITATGIGQRHGTLIQAAVRLRKLVLGGELPDSVLVDELLPLAHNIGIPEREVRGIIEWAVSEVSDSVSAPERDLITVAASRTTAPDALPTVGLDEIVEAARAYLDLPDPAPLLATLAAAATRDLDDEPVWLLLVGAPSGGKTEAIRALDDIADARLDDVSAAGMLSWKGGKKPAPVGVLTRVSGTGLVTFGDLSTLLASSDRGGRDQTFAMLRKVYDGHVARDLGNAPAPLMWEGRLTVVAAVTDAIDNYAAHADALGPRWLYMRLPARDTQGRRRAAAAARLDGLDDARRRLRALASAAVRSAAGRVNDTSIPDALAEAIEDAALVCCWGRAAVPRHGYGRREIDGLPIVEEPPRLVRQLRGLARGALALGLDHDYVEYLCRRVALDSMPAMRRQTLAVLADGEQRNTSGVARTAGMHRAVACRQLEELEAVGIVASTRKGPEPGEHDPDRRIATWQLDPVDGALVASVIRADAVGVTRKVGHHPPSPPRREEMERPPTLRVTSIASRKSSPTTEAPAVRLSDSST